MPGASRRNEAVTAALSLTPFSQGSRLALRWNHAGDLFVDPNQLDRRLIFGGADSGEAIASKRSDGGNKWGLDFLTGGISRMNITKDGNVGVGVQGPQAALHVRPASGKGEGLIVGGNASSGGYTTLNLCLSAEKGGYGTIQVVKSSGSAFGDLSLNPNGGNVYVKGDLYVDGYLKGKFGGAYYNLDKAAGAAIWSSSDQRLKQDITPIANALAAIKKLRGVTYHWNQTGLNHLSQDIEKNWESASRTPEDNQKLWDEKRREADAQNSKLQTGFIAQEVEQVFPDWVKIGDDGYKQIDMSRLNAVLVNALREQQEQIEAHQRLLTAQEHEFEALRNEVADLRRLTRQLVSGSETPSEASVAKVRR